jgi:uncharacterized protein YjbI with pentapeptide repeats
MNKTDMSRTYFNGCIFDNCKASDTSFFDSNLKICDFWKGIYTECDFRKAKLTAAVVEETTFTEGDFTEADLYMVRGM